MPSANVGDSTIHYRDAGSGNDAVLLLHAFPLNSEMWAPQLAFLGTRFRIIAPEYRGLGQSRPASDALTIDLIVDDVLSLLRQLGIRRVAVAGLSMGGYMAFALYRRAPGLVRGLALCATKATPDTEEGKAGREAFAQKALSEGLDWVAKDFAPKLLRLEPDAELLAAVQGFIRAGTPEGVASAQRAMARRVDSVPTLGTIRCPTIVVTGEEDQLMPPSEPLRMVHNIKGSRLVRIPGAGHLPNLENASAFNTALSTFFATLPR
jgi:pimeloyl-ACP methyl ester carboxylesterase